MSQLPQVRGIQATAHLDQPTLSPGKLVTPQSSPPSNPQTPVIVTNPNFLPPPPLLPRYSPYIPTPSLPPKPSIGTKLTPGAGRWDNYQSTPTYQRDTADFWSSRSLPIPITSTVSSCLSELDLMSDNQSEAASDSSQEVFETNMSWPARPSDANAAIEYKRLTKLRLSIIHKIERIEGSTITLPIAAWAENILDEIQKQTEELAVDLEADLYSEFQDTLEENFIEECKKSMRGLIAKVDKTNRENRELIFTTRECSSSSQGHQSQISQESAAPATFPSVTQPSHQQVLTTAPEIQVADRYTMTK